MKSTSFGEGVIALLGGSASWLLPLEVEASYKLLVQFGAFAGAIVGALLFVGNREGFLKLAGLKRKQLVLFGVVFVGALLIYFGTKLHTLTEGVARTYVLGISGALVCFILALGTALYANSLVAMMLGKRA